jgi:hypothetical protein
MSNIRKDFDGDALKRAIDHKVNNNPKHVGKPHWLRRSLKPKD